MSKTANNKGIDPSIIRSLGGLVGEETNVKDLVASAKTGGNVGLPKGNYITRLTGVEITTRGDENNPAVKWSLVVEDEDSEHNGVKHSKLEWLHTKKKDTGEAIGLQIAVGTLKGFGIEFDLNTIESTGDLLKAMHSAYQKIMEQPPRIKIAVSPQSGSDQYFNTYFNKILWDSESED